MVKKSALNSTALSQARSFDATINRSEAPGKTRTAAELWQYVESIAVKGIGRRLVYNQITSDNGLSENVVNSIIQDRRGFIWIGTHHGLNRYDGYYFKKFYTQLNDTTSLSDNTVKALAIDSSGMLWVGTSDGLNYFDPESGKNQRIKFSHGTALPAIKTIYVANKDTVLFSLRTGEVYLLKTKNKLIQALSNHNQLSEALRVLITEKLQSNFFVQPDQTEDKIWMATPKRLVCYDHRTNKAEQIDLTSTYNRMKAIPEIRSLFIDKDHNLWIATFGDGVLFCKTTEDQFHSIPIAPIGKDSIKRMVFGLFPWQNGEIAAESGYGNFFIVKDNAVRKYLQKDSLSLVKVVTLTLGRSIAELPQKQVDIIQNLYAKELLFPYRFVVTNDSTIITTGNNGVIRYQPNSVQVLSKNFSSPMVTDGSHYWTATTKGLLKIDRKTLTSQTILHQEGNPHSINENNLYSVWVDPMKKLWIGTKGGGLNYFDPVTERCTQYSIDQGLPDNVVYFALPDEHRNLWLGTNKGLCKFNTKDHSCRNYSLSDGLSNSEFNRDGGLRAGNGLIYLSGTNGIDYFDPVKVHSMDTVSPMIRFSTVLVNGAPVSPILHSKYTFNAEQNNVDFYFTANFFNYPHLVYYRYRLIGAQAEWRRVQGQNHVFYAGLAPGNHKFEVQASLNNTIWSKSNIFEFEIMPVWYATWWFKIALLMGILLAIYAYINQTFKQKANKASIQIENQRQVSNERERISADLHDDIGSTLSSISVYSELAYKYYHSRPEKSQEFLKHIIVQSRALMNRMDEIIWSLKVMNEPEKTLTVKLMEFGPDLLTTKNIALIVDVDPKLEGERLGYATSKNILLIIKEALNNVSKYSEAKKVIVKLWLDDFNHICGQIKDDGKGFENTTNSNGNGLQNMKVRAKALNGNLTVVSEIGIGTHISFRVPLATISHSNI